MLDNVDTNDQKHTENVNQKIAVRLIHQSVRQIVTDVVGTSTQVSGHTIIQAQNAQLIIKTYDSD